MKALLGAPPRRGDSTIESALMKSKRRSSPIGLKSSTSTDEAACARLWREAVRGDIESARLLLEMFCLAVERGEEPPRRLMAYLHFAFIRHLQDGKPLERALHLRLPHRAKGSHGRTADPLRVAALFYLHARSGMTPKRAKDEVASACAIDVRTVERAISAEKAGLDLLTDSELLVLSEAVS